MLLVIDALLIFLIVVFGLITSFEDIKFNKIRNKWVLLAIISAFLLLALRVVVILLKGSLINPKYFTEFFLNFFITFIVGILLWEMKLWSPADAKLFLAYAALVPISLYQWGYTKNFPSFVILINTFVPYFILYFSYILFKTSLKEKLGIIKEMLKPKQMINFVVFIFAFSWLTKRIFGFFNIEASLFMSVVVIFLVMVILTKILKINLTIAGIGISLFGLVLDYKTILTLQFLKQFVIILFVFIFIRFFVINLGFHFFSKPVPINNLKPGMILAEEIYKEKGKYKKRKFVPISFVTALFDKVQYKSVIKHTLEGLKRDDVQKIKQLHKIGKLKESKVRIAQTIPFAPFMFLGVILTTVCKGNLIIALKTFIESFI